MLTNIIIVIFMLGLACGCFVVIAEHKKNDFPVDHKIVNGYDAEALADAIYMAEGGTKSKHPYGITSISCESEPECRRICINTINNNYDRWIAYGAKGDFLSFLANRYAPIGAENDPLGLNKYWKKNVKHYLNKNK